MFLKKFPIRLLIAVAAGVIISKGLDVGAHFLLNLANILPPLSEPNFSTRDQVIILSMHSLFTIVSAFITALIAKKQARRAVSILGAKEAVFWLIGVVLLRNHGPFWVNISKAVLGPPLCWMGGKIYEHFRAGRQASGEPGS